jgi:hypothetical protein
MCLQGTIEPFRRDYAAAFEAASHPAVLAQLRRRKEKLLLVGSERLDAPPLACPEALQPYVHKHSNLEYKVRQACCASYGLWCAHRLIGRGLTAAACGSQSLG